jgi:hypothetical protein
MTQHKIYQVAKLLKLRVWARQEPSTGYWFAYIGHDWGHSTNAKTCTLAEYKNIDDALDALLLMVRDLVDHGELKEQQL